MKKTIGILLALIALTAAGGPPLQKLVSTNAFWLLPERTTQDPNLVYRSWSANASFNQGEMVSVGQRAYMAWDVSVGNSGTTTPNGKGIVSDGTNTWLFVPNKTRRWLTIINLGTNPVYVSYGYAAEQEKGDALLVRGASVTRDRNEWQGAVSIIAEAGTTGTLVSASSAP